MRRRVVLVQLVMIAALGAPAACAQIEGLSGLHYDGGNTNAGGASGSGGASSGTPSSSGPGGSGAGANGGSGAGANGGGSSVGGAGGAPPLCGNGATCVDVPNGWKGPIILYPNGSDSIMCPASYPNTAFDGGTMPSDAPVTCNGCACDQAPCGSFQLLVFQQPTCSDETTEDNIPDNAGCVTYNPTNAPSVSLVHTPGSGPCNASGGGVASRPATHFLNRALGCGLPTGAETCGAAGVCAPTVGAMPSCIYQSGSAACPASFPNSTSIFTSITDGRGCTSCTCGSPIGNCNGEVRLFTTTNCTGPNQEVPPDGQCHPSSEFQSAEPTTLSPCNPMGGAPGGSTSGSGAITICCK